MKGTKSIWPLVVFTVCAPLCAGAWVVAASLALLDAFPRAILLTMGYPGALLCVLLVASLGCSTLHLGKPVKALRAFMRLGNSTVSNEVFMGALFAAASVLYLATADSLAAAGELRSMLLAAVAAFAILFVVFQCLAYRMRTVPIWNSFAFSVEFAVIALLGGVCLEGVLACLALPVPLSVRISLVAVEGFGCLGMLFVGFAQGPVVAQSLAMIRGGQVMLRRWGFISAVRMVAIVFGSIVWGCGMLAETPAIPLVIAGMMMVVIGISIGRYAFYRFYANVGLQRGQC